MKKIGRTEKQANKLFNTFCKDVSKFAVAHAKELGLSPYIFGKPNVGDTTNTMKYALEDFVPAFDEDESQENYF